MTQVGSRMLDEPHPVGTFPAVAQFLKDSLVDRLLRLHKSAEIPRFAHGPTLAAARGARLGSIVPETLDRSYSAPGAGAAVIDPTLSARGLMRRHTVLRYTGSASGRVWLPRDQLLPALGAAEFVADDDRAHLDRAGLRALLWRQGGEADQQDGGELGRR